MVRATPDTRIAREAFAQSLREVRALEHDGQVKLHDLRRQLGRPLRPSDVPAGMTDAMEVPVEVARQRGIAVLGDADRVDALLTRAFRLEKAKVDREAGFDVRQ